MTIEERQALIEKMGWSRTFRVVDTEWHLAHQFEQIKFPFVGFTWLRQFKRQYSDKVRDDFFKQYGMNRATYYEPGKYDVAILHLDQQCFESGIWERGKGTIFRDLDSAITDIPKIVIMHGTPYYPEVYPDADVLKAKLKMVLGDKILVVNSKKAKEQWGVPNSVAIWHGLEADEWRDLPKEPRVVTMISPGGLPMYYDRTFLQAVKDALDERSIIHCHITVDWQAKDWNDYRDYLGRSLIYFNPTRESPMPRSRTEAMLSGCCVITTPTQDADTFIEHGVNGFLCRRNPEEVVDLIEELMKDYDRAVAIGQKGKETAIKLFGWERYADEWYKLLCRAVDEFKK